MEKRPEIKPVLTLSDKTIEVLGWLALLFLWLLTIYNYNNLPTTIVTHFNAVGEIDGYGNKNGIFILPIIGTIIFVVLTILNNYPHIFNYPTAITNENVVAQYTNATRMLRYLKLAVLIIFLSITTLTIKAANGQSNSLGIWFLPISISVIFIPMTFFIIKAFKRK